MPSFCQFFDIQITIFQRFVTYSEWRCLDVHKFVTLLLDHLDWHCACGDVGVWFGVCAVWFAFVLAVCDSPGSSEQIVVVGLQERRGGN